MRPGPNGPGNATGAAQARTQGNQAFIANLLQKGGFQNINNIPIPPKPDGTKWTTAEITNQQIEVLHVSTGGGRYSKKQLAKASYTETLQGARDPYPPES